MPGPYLHELNLCLEGAFLLPQLCNCQSALTTNSPGSSNGSLGQRGWKWSNQLTLNISRDKQGWGDGWILSRLTEYFESLKCHPLKCWYSYFKSHQDLLSFTSICYFMFNKNYIHTNYTMFSLYSALGNSQSSNGISDKELESWTSLPFNLGFYPFRHFMSSQTLTWFANFSSHIQHLAWIPHSYKCTPSPKKLNRARHCWGV